MTAALPPELGAVVRAAMAAAEPLMLFRDDRAESVLSAETLGNITNLVSRAREHLAPASLDVEAMYLAGCYHSMRSQYVAEEDRQVERGAAVMLFSVVHAAHPDFVPEPFRTPFAQYPPVAAPPADILHSVALTLFADAVRRRDVDGLWRTAGMIVEALRAAPSSDSEPTMVFNLGSVYAQLHKVAGHDGAIDKGVALMRNAVASFVAADRPVPDGMLAVLADAQAELPEATDPGESLRARVHRYVATGERDPAELDALIAAARAALDKTPPGTYDRTVLPANLAIALRIRFELSGNLDDIDESIALLTEVVPQAADNDRHHVHSALALAHLHRFVSNDEPDDLARAGYSARASFAGADPHSEGYPRLLVNLAAVLLARFDRFGDRTELAEAIRCLEFAAALLPGGNDHQVMRIKLAVALMSRGGPADLGRADGLLRSVRDGSTGLNRQLAQMELARAAGRQAELSGRAHDHSAAAARYRETAVTATHDFRTRLHAAHHWALHSANMGDIADATSAFGVALEELLPKFAGLGLGRRSQETRLRQIPSLACNAAWAEIRAGRPRQALVRLEQGRGVLLTQALRLRSLPRDLARPELVERFERVCAALVDEPGTSGRRRELAAEFDAVVGEIRGVPGFEWFQAPLEWPRLAAAADHGPVVVVNVAELGCDALLVRDDVQVIPLAGVTRAEVARRATRFLDAVSGMSTTADFTDRHERDRAMADTLAWLWDHIAGPVLAALEVERYADPPRIWWCPTGDLALLPLHAAHHVAGDTYVHDLVVSSYTPTLNALISARTAPHAAEPTSVAVGMTGELPAVEDELVALAESAGTTTELRDAAATPEAVLAALRTHTRAHLACHGVHTPDDPSGSGLRLHDGLLTVRDLATTRLRGAEFAFLSACHTATGGRALVDEVITLASALQMCGYRQVVGALWTVEDEVMPALVREVYRRIPASGAARALHDATHWLRTTQHYASPLFWASLAHIGI